MRRTLFILAACLLSIIAKADVIAVNMVAPFAQFSGASSDVRDECNLETRVPADIVKASKGDTEIVLTNKSLDSVQGPTLFVHIANVHAPGGGNWSGGKRVTVIVELKEEDGTVINKEFQRSSRTGFGTCAILKKISRVLGEDIVGWLQWTRRKRSPD